MEMDSDSKTPPIPVKIENLPEMSETIDTSDCDSGDGNNVPAPYQPDN